MSPEEWIKALRMHIESLNSNLEKQIEVAAVDGENIRQLAKIV